MRQKGFVLLPILIIVVLIGVAGYFYYQNIQLRNSDESITSPVPTLNTKLSEPSLTPSPAESWNNYRNTLYSYTMEYPPDWQVSETKHGVTSKIDPSEENTMTEITNNNSTIRIFYEGDWDHGFEPWVFESSDEIEIGGKVSEMTILTLEGNQNEWRIYTIDNFNDFRIEVSVAPTDKDIINEIISTLKFIK